jgi:hypothetical protein
MNFGFPDLNIVGFNAADMGGEGFERWSGNIVLFAALDHAAIDRVNLAWASCQNVTAHAGLVAGRTAGNDRIGGDLAHAARRAFRTRICLETTDTYWDPQFQIPFSKTSNKRR